jgi:hypothetical protein
MKLKEKDQEEDKNQDGNNRLGKISCRWEKMAGRAPGRQSLIFMWQETKFL